METLTPADLRSAAQKCFTDAGLIVTTLSKSPLPEGIERAPSLATLKPAVAFTAEAGSAPAPATLQSANANVEFRIVQQKSVLPQLNMKLLFTVGSAHDPAGKEGLAALTAAMIADAGSRLATVEQIEAALYPIAGSFSGRVDKEMTTFTGRDS